MQFRQLAAFLVVSLLSGASGPNSAVRAAELHGAELHGVVESAGRPVAGAVVRLSAVPEPRQELELLFSGQEPAELARAKTGTDGAFTLIGPEEGFYRLTVEAAGHLAAERFCFLAAPARPQEFELVPARQVTLTVAGPDGRPLAGARLRAGFSDPMAGALPLWPAFIATAADGSATMAIPRDVAAEVWVIAAGLAPRQVELAPRGADRATVTLGPGSELPVVVKGGPHRQPLAGVAIVLAEAGLAIGRSGEDGRATLRLEPGPGHLFFADAAGRRDFRAWPAPLPAAGTPWPVELEDPIELRGRVVELPSREPLADAWLVAWEWPPRVARSGRGGAFALSLARQEGQQLMAMKSGYRSAQQGFSATAPELTIGLAAAARVAGRVLDDQGRAVADAEVKLEVERSALSTRIESSKADAQGRFTLDEVPANAGLRIQAALGERRSAWLELSPIAAGESRGVELVLVPEESWTGRVVDPSGRGIAGAELVLVSAEPWGAIRYEALSDWTELRSRGPAAVADGEGRVAVRGLAAGSYSVAVRAKGFAPLLRPEVEVGGEQGVRKPATIVLQPAALTHGRVVDESGRGVAGAELRLRLIEPGERGWAGGHAQPPAVAASGAEGEFAFAEVAAGQAFDLVATKDGYAPAFLPGAAMVAGQALELRLSRAGLLRGRILSRGEPLPRVWVRLEALDEEQRTMRRWRELQLGASTDPAGVFAIGGLSPGRYQLEVDGPPGLQDFLSSPFTVGSGETKARDIELEPAALIYGRVLLPSGEAAPETQVSYVRGADPDGNWTDSATADAFGAYRLEGAAPGVGWLRVRAPGYREVVRKVTAAAGDNAVDLRLTGGSAVLTGRVIGPDGQPLADVRATLMGDFVQAGGRPLYVLGRTDADGQVSFAALESGKYRIELDRQGFAHAAETVELEDGDVAREWRLSRAGTRLHGALIGLEPGESADLWVRAFAADGPEIGGRVEGGRYEIGPLATGSWTVAASSPRTGIVMATPVEIAEGERDAELDLDFGQLGGRWSGEVRKGGEPARGLQYTLYAAGQSRPLQSATSRDGRIGIRAPPGRYRLDFFLPPDLVRYLEIEIGPPSELTIELEISPP